MERVRLMNHSGEMDGEYRHGGSFDNGVFLRYSLLDLKNGSGVHIARSYGRGKAVCDSNKFELQSLIQILRGSVY